MITFLWRLWERLKVAYFIKDMRRAGVVSPIIISKGGKVVDGNHRVTLARELGIKQVPAIRLEVEVEMVDVADVQTTYDIPVLSGGATKRNDVA